MLSILSGLLIILGSAALLFAVNYIFNAKNKASKANFLVADRSAHWLKTSFSIAAAWVWAPALFIAAQQAYQNGWVGVFWFTVPNIVCLVLFAFFAEKVRNQMPNGFTLSGYIAERFGKPTQKVYAFCLLLLSLLSFAVQLLAGGLVISTLTGISYTVITLLLTIIAVGYSWLSGLKASLTTGTVKMVMIFIIGLGAAIAIATNSGTVSAGLAGVGGVTNSLFSGAGLAVFWSFGLASTIGLLSGPFGDQAFWQRAFAVEKRYVKRSFIVGALLFAVVPIAMSVLGFAVAGAGIVVDNVQLTNITAVVTWLPMWALVCFVATIIVGLLSTLDSNLCAASSIIGNDFSNPQKSVKNARIAMITLAVLGVIVANIPDLTIVKLFIIYGTLRASSFIPTLLIIGTKLKLRGGAIRAGILSALIVGVPLSAYGNLNSNTTFVVGGALAVLIISATVSIIGSYFIPQKKRVANG